MLTTGLRKFLENELINIKKQLKLLSNKFGYEVNKIAKYSLLDTRYREMGRDHSKKLINIGAGNFRHPFWVNVDKDNDFYRKEQSGSSFVSFDLLLDKSLPFEDSSIDVIYTSHTIEHLTNASVQNIFNEIFRCLKSGGVFRITCPDMGFLHNAYGLGDKYIWPQPSPWNTRFETIEERFLEHFATILLKTHQDQLKIDSVKTLMPIEFSKLYHELELNDFFESISAHIPVNSNAYFPQGHCNWFTHNKIEQMIHKSGFSQVNRSAYGQSQEPVMRNINLFDNTCPELSLYVEAVK